MHHRPSLPKLRSLLLRRLAVLWLMLLQLLARIAAESLQYAAATVRQQLGDAGSIAAYVAAPGTGAARGGPEAGQPLGRQPGRRR